MILLSESSATKVVITSVISNAVAEALKNAIPSAVQVTPDANTATAPSNLANDFPGRKVEQ